ncbi:MAG: imidazoleglycerol-phosphate dehydratase HisB [Clostridia bacterium]|jgi:Imidazoleglycerol-phosphate dehydratase|nr:imidazoleglycerol-phosphate dehydratase HisB [Clostridia bacterium]
MRQSEITRLTGETDIRLKLELDGSGKSEINTGVGFLDHMLAAFAKHARFDLAVCCKGDTQVDDHHSVEDVGIALGQAFLEALGDKKGISRFGCFLLPMDEALVMSAADISGRAHLEFDVPMPCQKVGSFDTELVKEFFLGFVRSARITLHLKLMSGENTHHIIEAAFKSAARSLKQAVSPDAAFPDDVPSTKGVL